MKREAALPLSSLELAARAADRVIVREAYQVKRYGPLYCAAGWNLVCWEPIRILAGAKSLL